MIIFYLFMVLPVVAVLSLLIYLPIYLLKKRKYGKRPFLRHLAIYTFIGVVLSILYATIFIGMDITFHPEYRFLNLTPFIWVKETYEMGAARMVEQLLMNIVMLIPLGFILPIVFPSLRKWWKTGFYVMTFVLCIEVFQYFMGRSADIDDLIMNTLGGLIGYAMMKLCNRCFGKKTCWKNACNTI